MENKTKRKTAAKIARMQRKNAAKANRRAAENKRQLQSRAASESERAPPPRENFRDADICPSAEELLGTDPAPIRRNVTNGAYESAEDYLDLQFWLLREDFVRPVREGLAKIRAHEEVTSEETFNPQMKVYKDVCFEKLTPDFRETLTILVKIDPDQINLGNDKLFMYGSLLCFSRTDDNFSDVIICKVADCCPDLLRKGLIKVSLINQYEILDIVFGATYSMVESEVYFEPYYRVLTALQTMALETFPLCNYVIGKATVVKTISQMRWDVEDNPGLNARQLTAYQRALTNNLTLIQGPPGTGKTFLGLKVVKRMIELNEERENDSGQRQPPILVICATNHALDQFLEHIVEFSTDVIRVGGQSHSLLLDDYMMAKKRRQYRNVNKGIKNLMEKIENTISQLQRSIETKTKRLNAPETLLDEQMELEDEILAMINERGDHSLEYQGCKMEMDLVVLRDARLVGMTTTSAARLRPLLDHLRPSIMIVEEAAEVLEGHIVGALTRHCKHLVLIGDHQQLRPITSCYKLSKEYRLDVSLFERLCKNRVPFVTLDTQHRMRPELAQLLVPTIYKHLVSDVSVRQRPDVRGVDNNLFFVSHMMPEQAAGYSRKNPHEAEFLMALCRYLILQGYAPEKITIIAMYAAQVTELENLRAKHVSLNPVVISSVDGYQGEENDIVLLSLVRSNKQAFIGFLWTINRVCVALSRARLGLYIVGNMENLTRDQRSVWCRINTALARKQAVGTHLKLRCSAHNRAPVSVNCAADFALTAAAAGDCVLGCKGKPRPPGSLETLLDELDLADKPTLSATYTNGNLAKCASMQTILDAMDRQRAGQEAGQGLPAPKANGTTVRATEPVKPMPTKHFFAADFEPPASLKPLAAVTPFAVGRAEEARVDVPYDFTKRGSANGAAAVDGEAKLASRNSSGVDLRNDVRREMEEFDKQVMIKRNALLARAQAEERERRAREAQELANLKKSVANFEEMRRAVFAAREAESVEKRLGRQRLDSAAPSAPTADGWMQTGAIPKTRAGDGVCLPSQLRGPQKPLAPMPPTSVAPKYAETYRQPPNPTGVATVQAPKPTYAAQPQVPKPTYVSQPQVPKPAYVSQPQVPKPTSVAQLQVPKPAYVAQPQVSYQSYAAQKQAQEATYVAQPQAPKSTYQLAQAQIPHPVYAAPAQTRPTNFAPTPAPRTTAPTPAAARPIEGIRENYFEDLRENYFEEIRENYFEGLEKAHEAALLRENRRQLAMAQSRAREMAEQRAAEKKKKSTCAVM